MSNEQGLPTLLASLQSTLKLQAAMMAKFEQRELRMQTTFDQRMQLLQGEVALAHRRVDDIVGGASARIAKDAKEALAPVSAQYDRAVSTTSSDLRKASKAVWMWFGAAGAIPAAGAARRLGRGGLLPPGTRRRQGRAAAL